MTATIAALLWVICGALTYALTLAFFQRKYPGLAEEGYREDRHCAVFVACFGPFGLCGVLIHCGVRYGLKWR